jgi:hypothetical protein
MALKARLKVTAVTKHDSGAETLELKFIEDPTLPVADKLETGVPNGTMTVRVDNAVNIGKVQPNQEYYITFSAAP